MLVLTVCHKLTVQGEQLWAAERWLYSKLLRAGGMHFPAHAEVRWAFVLLLESVRGLRTAPTLRRALCLPISRAPRSRAAASRTRGSVDDDVVFAEWYQLSRYRWPGRTPNAVGAIATAIARGDQVDGTIFAFCCAVGGIRGMHGSVQNQGRTRVKIHPDLGRGPRGGTRTRTLRGGDASAQRSEFRYPSAGGYALPAVARLHPVKQEVSQPSSMTETHGRYVRSSARCQDAT